MIRVQAFIDGFNLYHAIDDLTKTNPSKHTYKWLNLKTLMEAYIKPSQEVLNDVFYFSAYATWKSSSYIKHKTYIEALKSVGVTPILGKFKEKRKTCFHCKQVIISHEEKESDVNLCINLLQNAHLNNFDKAIVVSSDSDMVPVIDMIKNTFPTKEIVIVVPPNRYAISNEIRSKVTALKMKEKHIKNNLLDDVIVTTYSNATITKPSEW